MGFRIHWSVIKTKTNRYFPVLPLILLRPAEAYIEPLALLAVDIKLNNNHHSNSHHIIIIALTYISNPIKSTMIDNTLIKCIANAPCNLFANEFTVAVKTLYNVCLHLTI